MSLDRILVEIQLVGSWSSGHFDIVIHYLMIISQVSFSSCEFISSIYLSTLCCLCLLAWYFSCNFSTYLTFPLHKQALYKTVVIACNERKMHFKITLMKYVDCWTYGLVLLVHALAYFNYLASCWLTRSLMLYSLN